jgi:hypothetical protein
MYQLKGYFRVPNLSLKDQDAKDVIKHKMRHALVNKLEELDCLDLKEVEFNGVQDYNFPQKEFEIETYVLTSSEYHRVIEILRLLNAYSNFPMTRHIEELCDLLTKEPNKE